MTNAQTVGGDDAQIRLSALGAAWYDLRALGRYVPRPLARRILGRRYARTPQAVLDEYDEVRRQYHQSFLASPPPLDAYLVSDADLRAADRAVHQLDGKLVYGYQSASEQRVRNRLVEAIGAYRPVSVIEFGCGSGRNLLAIKRAYPDVRCVGLELSPASVELARAASRHYALPIEVQVADVTRPLPPLEAATVCCSVHALEQIPAARYAFDQMYALATDAVVLFEPITECFGWSPRAIAARVRARHLDRLQGLYGYLQTRGYRLSGGRPLPDAAEPLNPTVELHVLKR
jgi:SAM-dependent methyltransferase